LFLFVGVRGERREREDGEREGGGDTLSKQKGFYNIISKLDKAEGVGQNSLQAKT